MKKVETFLTSECMKISHAWPPTDREPVSRSCGTGHLPFEKSTRDGSSCL